VIHIAPAPHTMFRRGSTLPVSFQLAGYDGTPISDATAGSLGACAATVTYPGRAPSCAIYRATDHSFHANVATPATARLGVPVTLAIGATVDNTRVASASLAVDPVPTLAVTDTVIHPPANGLANIGIRITLGAASAQTITFNWATAQGSAHSPADYIGTAASATIPAGSTSTTVYVHVRGHAGPEPNKTFYVLVWAPQHAIVTKPTGTQIIVGHH
jgi:hypothetical protein